MSAETGHSGVVVGDNSTCQHTCCCGRTDITPALPSPFIGRTYLYRMIDLEHSQKTNATAYMVAGWHELAIEWIVISIPCGEIIEPWE